MFATYRLPDAMPGEKVVTVIHCDAFVAVKRVLFFIFLIAIPVALIAMIRLLFPNAGETIWFWPLLLVLTSSYLLFVWLLFFYSLIDYFLDVWIITNIRIIDVRQDGLFSRTIAEVRLDKIQDVSSEISGFFETFLGYGNVVVQTASEKNALFFEEVSNPDNIRDILVRLTSKEHTQANLENQ
ncbi:MAG: PH domain-containing protein [Candidatus Falkowbacteria bacterium]|nr:PH domain-containing protein [Candidatus Falkowbacteria bacterium]